MARAASTDDRNRWRTTILPRTTCRDCGKLITILPAGYLREHGPLEARCVGSSAYVALPFAPPPGWYVRGRHLTLVPPLPATDAPVTSCRPGNGPCKRRHEHTSPRRA